MLIQISASKIHPQAQSGYIWQVHQIMVILVWYGIVLGPLFPQIIGSF